MQVCIKWKKIVLSAIPTSIQTPPNSTYTSRILPFIASTSLQSRLPKGIVKAGHHDAIEVHRTRNSPKSLIVEA